MQNIIPTIWFNDNAEEAVRFYTSVFAHATTGRITPYTEAGKEQHGHQAGSVMTIEFEIEGMQFVGLNGGPQFPLTPAISFFVNCVSEDEINGLWQKLTKGGEVRLPLTAYPFSKRYGWVSDQFGVSWQLMLVDEMPPQKVMPSLLFAGEQTGHAEEAMQFYMSVFPDSKQGMVSRYQGNEAPGHEGQIAYGECTLLGQQVGFMDSGVDQDVDFNEGISLEVMCKDQAEIDAYWEKLSAVPEAEMCGWLKDKYGVSWQIVPTAMNDMLNNGTPEQIERVVAAFMQMKKFDIATLERAYNG
ncbi:MAG TPA: VOC family protein [Candidatus Saccharimonadales bacterium]|jgi:predicted 3-demethylubiquinone-9 3-methyltransferase (glyoxalase superfamily)|nr:VOC family protein [Candidatus Saccharimonadales bacterium]